MTISKQAEDRPEVVEKTPEELDAIIASIQSSNLPDTTKTFVLKTISIACWLPQILQKKNISIARLKHMLFGKGKTKRKKKNEPDDDNNNSGNSSANSQRDEEHGELPQTEQSTNSAPSSSEEAPEPKGHGRNSHEVYQTFDECWHCIEEYQQGSPCPTHCKGKLYALPCGVVVRISGQSMAKVTKHYLEKLRCNVCGYCVRATLPEALGTEKYTASFRAHLALSKFYLATPYYRLDAYQRLQGNPIADATQWEQIEKLAGFCYAVYGQLKYLLANDKLVYCDDTYLKILEVIKQLKHNDSIKRRGMYTTCMLGGSKTHPIVLYVNGVQHCGENIETLLKQRDKTEPILQMSDAHHCNTPATIATIACYCLSHGFRKFDEIADFFPNECLPIMHALGKVFEIDAATKTMSDETRLAYHQQHSAPILTTLYDTVNTLLASKHVEPNGELAKALRYLTKHWAKLTAFLRILGAPIDNNVVERALKLAIRVRKNALFYKSTYSASVSGVITSIIYTCQLNTVSPIDYFMALEQYADAVTAAPKQWLPWNYQETIALKQAPTSAHPTVTAATNAVHPKPVEAYHPLMP